MKRRDVQIKDLESELEAASLAERLAKAKIQVPQLLFFFPAAIFFPPAKEGIDEVARLELRLSSEVFRCSLCPLFRNFLQISSRHRAETELLGIQSQLAEMSRSVEPLRVQLEMQV